MPVTRSTSGGRSHREEAGSEDATASNPSSGTTESGTTMESTTGTSEATTTVVPTADVALSPIPQVAAGSAAAAAASNAAAAATPSHRSKKLRKAQAIEEELALEQEILEMKIALSIVKKKRLANRVAEEDKEDNTSHISESDADVNERVRSWIEESTPLAISDKPHCPAESAAPAVSAAAPAESAAVSAAESAAVPAFVTGGTTCPRVQPVAVTNSIEKMTSAEPAVVTGGTTCLRTQPVAVTSKIEEITPPCPPCSSPNPINVEIGNIKEAVIALAERSLRPHMHSASSELPKFGGAFQEWFAFNTAYEETAAHHSPLDNKSRLRRCLYGRASTVVNSLLSSIQSTPEDIMKTLEWNFGRAETIATHELERLRNLPRAGDDPKDLISMTSRVKDAVEALQSLKKQHSLYNDEVARTIVKKMPGSVRYRWYETCQEMTEEDPPLVQIKKFLLKYVGGCAQYADPEIAKNEHKPAPTSYQQQRKQRTFATQDAEESETTLHDRDRRSPSYGGRKYYEERGKKEERDRKCIICEEKQHNIRECKKFNEADIDRRWDLAKQHQLCFRCLRFRNKSHSCNMNRCNINGCPARHNRMLHREKKTENVKKEAETVTTTWTNMKSKSYLKMVPVRVSAPAGEIDTWALLDDGSTVTLIDSNLADAIGARGPIDPLHIEAITEKNLNASRSRRVTVTLRRNNAVEKIHARTIDRLRLSPQQVSAKDIERCQHLRGIEDHIKYPHAEPKILIGQDNWHLLLAAEVRKGHRDQPIASLTPLGWVLHGAHTRSIGQRVNYVHHLKAIDENMDEQLRQHFAIENMGIEPKKPSTDPEQRALKILEESTVQRADGHYEVALLWKSDAVTMPENYENAVRRLHSVEKKLEKDETLKKKYSEQMEALIEKGYAEPAPEKREVGKSWYLPHFGVTNQMKPDKLRIVHDAAARTGGTSLNDQLLSGPDLLQSLPGVLMRFRQHKIAVSADIAEMFMQVKIREEDRDFLRYIWKNQEYRMTSLIFGATCSPSTAIFIKNKNASKFQEKYPEAAAAIVKNHYVDDYLDSYETEEEAARIATQVREIHRGARLELRKWASNSPPVLKQLIDDEGSTTGDKKTLADGASSERVLGLVWRPDTDELAFNLDLARIPKEMLNRAAPTKRIALKIVMSLYDPMGLAAPVTIKAKQILQEVWRRGTEWDNDLDSDLSEQWREWMLHLENLRFVSVPRRYLHYSDAVNLQLHTFVDASETAYAAAIYWRAVTPEGHVTLTLAMGKAKVAPLKLTSIPRLELQAAVMGSRMAAAVIEEHDRKPDSKTYWTDSKTVLTWVKTGSRSYKPFVAHRIAAIEENTAVHEWRWVPTKLNVADDATRDVPQDFTSAHRWYAGPSFLQNDESEWPTERVKPGEPTGEEKCTYTRSADSRKISECVPDPENISKWLIYLRATARVLQFIDLCRQKKEKVNYKRTKKIEKGDKEYKITTDKKTVDKKLRNATPSTGKNVQRRYHHIDNAYLRRAEDLIVRAIQESCFSSEIEELKKEKTVSRNSRLYALAVTYEDNIIRVKSRISAVRDVTATVAPPVTDGNDRRVKLYIENVHRRLSHAGAEMTINECRQHYWILRLRPVTRKIVNECVLCRIRRAQPSQPSTGNHPPSRLAHHQRPFTYTGLDYFGPLTVTVGRTQQKRYVAIFTCLTTRAVHLEVAASLSTDSAVMALRRMISRRGCPTEIWSDNGTNLHGADKELRRAIDEATHSEAEKKMISWRYIPPGAPFMGGAWERLVRSVKVALAATQQSRHPTEEVLSTLLAEAEYTVNSRPLTHVSVDHQDEEALTPNHFLLGGSALTPAPGSFSDGDLIGRANWRASQRLADLFWARWLREYLPELQHRREPHGKGPALQLGDLVLIVDNTLPRNTWPRGMVTATFPGTDGVVRAADIRTRGGILRRPTKKLVIIPTATAADPSPTTGCNDGGGAGVTRRENVRDGRQNSAIK